MDSVISITIRQADNSREKSIFCEIVLTVMFLVTMQNMQMNSLKKRIYSYHVYEELMKKLPIFETIRHVIDSRT